MCCGDEHKNDPKYARSRCSSGVLLCNEITYCVLIIVISFVSVVIGVVLCALAMNGSASDVTYTDKFVAASPEKLCSTWLDCSSGQLCRGTCKMAGAVNSDYIEWNTEMTDTSLNQEHEAVTNARLCDGNNSAFINYGGDCASANINASETKPVYTVNADGTSVTKQYVAHARYSDIFCSKMICYEKEKKSRRLQEIGGSPSTILSEDPKYLNYMPLPFQMFVHGIKKGLKTVLQNPKLSTLTRGHKEVKTTHGRKLLLTTEEQDEIKSAGKAGCDAATLISVAFYGSIVFGIVGIVFASIQACECCKGACGGYRGRNKMFAIYGAVATIWQVVPFIMYLSFYLATKRVVDVLLKFGIGAEVFDAILGVLLVCVLLAVSLVVTRGINTVLSWAAAKSPHSTESPTAAIVQAAGQVQMVKPESYVVVDPQQQA